jgi:TPR repeat protein
MKRLLILPVLLLTLLVGSYKTAVMWYRLAAEQGDADAQNKLGAMYGLGTGVIQDNVFAHM